MSAPFIFPPRSRATAGFRRVEVVFWLIETVCLVDFRGNAILSGRPGKGKVPLPAVPA